MVVMYTRGSSKLTSIKRKELILNLCRAICVLNSPKEVADAITDLLTPKEVETIAKRLQIAEMLVNKKDYSEIREDLKVGYSTISRVNTWLNLSGDGFKIMLSRKKNSPSRLSDDDIYDPYSWHNVKRRYSMHFLPWMIFEEFARNADKDEKQKIKDIIDKLKLKAEQFSGKSNKELYEMLRPQFFSKKRKQTA
jgi:TrpR-related protein YerC/YecD